MPDVIEQLQRYAATVESVIPPTNLGQAEAGTATHRPRSVLTLAAVATVLVVLAASLIALDRRESPTGLTTDPSTDPPTGEGWSTFPVAPIAGRVGASAVASSDEMLVWGGRAGEVLADGAAFSFETRTWRTIAESPLSPRESAVSVWTGTEMIVWGGVDGSFNPLTDGAAYNPASDAWRRLPTNDVGALNHTTGAVWTGLELLLVGVTDAAGQPTPAVWALDPSAGWRTLDGMPAAAPSGGRTRQVHVEWTGSEALVVSFVDLEPVTIDRLDVSLGVWGQHFVTDAPGLGTNPDGVVLVGGELVIVGHYKPGAIFDVSTGAVEALAPSGSTLRFSAVVVGGTVTSGDRWLEVATREWHDADPVPGRIREFPVAVGDGERSYVWGGDACGPAANCAELVDPEIGISWAPPSTAGAVPTVPPTTTTTVVQDPQFSTAAKSLDQPSGSLISAIRVARQTGVDRVVFEFEGEVPPIEASYGSAPSSGECVPPDAEGPAFLNLRIRSSTQEPVAGGFRSSYDGPERVTGDTAAVSSLVLACDFEGFVFAAISLVGERPFALYALSDPGRLVIDISTGG